MLLPELDKKLATPIYMQIHHSIVKNILEGWLKPDESLPSIRKLALELGVSRTSIENAFGQLLAEGYVYSVPGSGYYVEKLEMFSKPNNLSEAVDLSEKNKPYDYDFAREYVAPSAFDFRLWKKQINYVINYKSEALYSYGLQRGELSLREALGRLFYRSRGVVASSSSIVIGSGVSPLLAMLSQILREEGIDGVVLENPGFEKAYGVFQGNGMTIGTMDVDFEGAHLEQLFSTKLRACYVSPSHHFPTGYVMPMKDRQKLLNWADERNAYIIEDDYNFELRFEGHPIPAMQAIDQHNRVVYLGSFSTVLAPAIRISFMVLPPRLNQIFEKHAGMFPQTASKLEQLALAQLITNGDFEQHVRRIRKVYTKKQQLVIELLKKYLPETVTIKNAHGGLQMILGLPEGIQEKVVVEKCRQLEVNINGLNVYSVGENAKMKGYLVLGFRGIESDLIDEGIRRIGEAIKEIIKIKGC